MDFDKEKLVNIYLVPMISLAILILFILVILKILDFDFGNGKDNSIQKIVTIEGMNTHRFSKLFEMFGQR